MLFYFEFLRSNRSDMVKALGHRNKNAAHLYDGDKLDEMLSNFSILSRAVKGAITEQCVSELEDKETQLRTPAFSLYSFLSRPLKVLW